MSDANMNGMMDYTMNYFYGMNTVILSGLTPSAQSTANGTTLVGIGFATQMGQAIMVNSAQTMNILTGTSSPSSGVWGTGQAADTTNPRIDIVVCQYNTQQTNSVTRTFENTSTNSTYTQNVNLYTSDYYSFNVIHGTPAATPTAPSVPSGWFLVATVAVPANATVITSSDITDNTPTLKTSGGWLSNVTGGILYRDDTQPNSSPILHEIANIQHYFGATAYLHDNADGYLHLQGSTSGFKNLSPNLFSYSGTALTFQPAVDASAGTPVFLIESAGGTILHRLDNEGGAYHANGMSVAGDNYFSGSSKMGGIQTTNGALTDLYGTITLHGGTNLTINPLPYPSGLTVTVGTSGTVGTYLVASTSYTYSLTAVSWNGVETNATAGVTVTEGATAYPITTSWTLPSTDTQFVNVYKNGDFLAQVSGTTTSYTDAGSVATTTQTPPAQNFTGALQGNNGAKLTTLGGGKTYVISGGNSTADSFWVTDYLGNDQFKIFSTNKVQTKNNTLDDGSSGAQTIAGLATFNASASLPNGQSLYLNGGTDTNHQIFMPSTNVAEWWELGVINLRTANGSTVSSSTPKVQVSDGNLSADGSGTFGGTLTINNSLTASGFSTFNTGIKVTTQYGSGSTNSLQLYDSTSNATAYLRAGPGGGFQFVNTNFSSTPFEVDNSGNLSAAGSISSDISVQSIAGTTAGTIYWFQDSQGSYKRTVVYLAGYENSTTTAQTISFPTAYTYTPWVNNVIGVAGTSASTTTLTINPDNTTVYSGLIFVEGH